MGSPNQQQRGGAAQQRARGTAIYDPNAPPVSSDAVGAVGTNAAPQPEQLPLGATGTGGTTPAASSQDGTPAPAVDGAEPPAPAVLDVLAAIAVTLPPIAVEAVETPAVEVPPPAAPAVAPHAPEAIDPAPAVLDVPPSLAALAVDYESAPVEDLPLTPVPPVGQKLHCSGFEGMTLIGVVHFTAPRAGEFVIWFPDLRRFWPAFTRDLTAADRWVCPAGRYPALGEDEDFDELFRTPRETAHPMAKPTPAPPPKQAWAAPRQARVGHRWARVLRVVTGHGFHVDGTALRNWEPGAIGEFPVAYLTDKGLFEEL